MQNNNSFKLFVPNKQIDGETETSWNLESKLIDGRRIVRLDKFQIKERRIINARKSCDERGYHLVSSEPVDKEKTMICNDCELFFNRRYAEDVGLKYRVESS